DLAVGARERMGAGQHLRLGLAGLPRHLPHAARACAGGYSEGAATTPIRVAAHGESRVRALSSAPLPSPLLRSAPRYAAYAFSASLVSSSERSRSSSSLRSPGVTPPRLDVAGAAAPSACLSSFAAAPAPSCFADSPLGASSIPIFAFSSDS